jgi:glycosyltransferase involved in cell wall biosynthesis
MKICHVITTLERGGAESQLLVLVKEQILQGHSVTVFPLKNKLELLEVLVKAGAIVDTKFLDKNFLLQFKTVLMNKPMEFDVVHAHLPQAELLTTLIEKNKRIVSRHFGGQFYPNRNKFLSRMLSRIATHSCRYVIAISTSVKEQLIENKEISDVSKIVVIEYGFNASDYTKAIEAKESKDSELSGELVIGTLARLSPEKDLTTLIRAFAISSDNFEIKAKLEIYGDGPERQKLTALIKELEMTDKVVLAGRTMSPASKMSSFDLFILTSIFEGFGMVLLEAMACKRPIICSNISTAREVLGDSGAAIFFEPGNEFDLAQKMLNWRTMLNPQFHEMQIERLSMYSAVTMAARIQDIYLGLLSARNQRGSLT